MLLYKKCHLCQFFESCRRRQKCIIQTFNPSKMVLSQLEVFVPSAHGKKKDGGPRSKCTPPPGIYSNRLHGVSSTLPDESTRCAFKGRTECPFRTNSVRNDSQVLVVNTNKKSNIRIVPYPHKSKGSNVV